MHSQCDRDEPGYDDINKRITSMDLSLSDKHRALQDEVRGFVREHGHKSPKLGGGRKRPDQKALDWQKLLVDHGYVARTIPREYGGTNAFENLVPVLRSVHQNAFNPWWVGY